MARHLFVCNCSSVEHQFSFVFDCEDEDPDYPIDEFYLEVHLSQYRGFWKRVWTGIKYMFGYHCKYGHWDTTGLRVEDAKRLRNLLGKFIYKSEGKSPEDFDGCS